MNRDNFRAQIFAPVVNTKDAGNNECRATAVTVNPPH